VSVLKVPVTSQDHILGDENASVTLVEYGDYECPYCGAAHPIIKQILETFGPDLRFVYRHFPLTNVHPNAEIAAEAAEAAGSQGKFWPMHDWLFENQQDLGMRSFAAAARHLKLDVPLFLDELAAHAHHQKIQADFMGGVRSGVNGTPTFFINGVRHDGSYAYEGLAAAISGALQQAA